MRRFLLVALLLASVVANAGATGFHGPMVYLDEGGKNVDASPEFYWDLELKRIAQEFRAPEKLLKREPNRANSETGDPRPHLQEVTANVDRADFEEALTSQAIRPDNAADARQKHEAARQAIAAATNQTGPQLPQEFPSEFADYHRGALAFRLGAEHFAEAREAWLALLNRPEQERHYRTVWATFMLGKLALKSGGPDAQKWFQQTRDAARRGFVDSLGFAADSYGWEGRAEWKQDHAGEAARLFLTQLALGDESAVVSIKALIPDRRPIYGVLNYGEASPDEIEQAKPRTKEQDDQELSALRSAVKDPLLRRLITVHILATGSSRNYFGEEAETAAARAKRWLQVIKAAKLPHVEEAEYLGWAAYMRGDFADAAHWLKLSSATSPAAFWLKAKLERRAGHLAEAAKAMQQAWQSIHEISAYTGWTGGSRRAGYYGPDDDYAFVVGSDDAQWNFAQQAHGDLAALQLQRGDFVQALDLFFKGDLWNDAAYVAERVLSTDELRLYVDQLPPPAPSSIPSVRPYDIGWQGELSPQAKLRFLLGRRLVREDHYDDARRYLPPPFDQILRRYEEALRAGSNTALPKEERAVALFRAAWLARYDGMELMGTEIAPDGFTDGGDFEVPDIATQRVAGKYEQVQYTQQADKKSSVPTVLKATREEIQRLTKTRL